MAPADRARRSRPFAGRLGLSRPGRLAPAPRGDRGVSLGVSRGVVCVPGQVFVTAGYQGGAGPDRRRRHGRAMRSGWNTPAYPFARLGLESAGATLVPIRVDRDGLDVAEAARRAPDARFAVVTPSHQSPLGVSLSLARGWRCCAGRRGRRLGDRGRLRQRVPLFGSPLPALKSLDREERLLYAGSFSKVLFPGLRLGYLVVPVT